MTQLGAQDMQFLHIDSDSNFANVSLVLLYEPGAGGRKPTLETLLAHVRSRIHTSPLFRRRLQRVPLDLDFPYWVDDEFFDVEFHVHYTALPKPGTWQQFTQFVSKYHNRPMDMSRPLWEICMIDGLDKVAGMPRGSFALISKAHHAALDGVTGMQFFAGLSDSDAKGTPAVDIDEPVAAIGGALGERVMLQRAFFNNLRAPLRLWQSARRLAPAIGPMLWDQVRSGSLLRGMPRAPETRFNAPVLPKRHFDSCWFPLADFKRIRRAVNDATVNDVVLAVCGGALRKYLENHKELPTDSLLAWVPINARPKQGDGSEYLGNQISAMMVPLRTDLAGPLARLAEISRITQGAKSTDGGMPTRLMFELSQQVPPYAMGLAARAMVQANSTMRMCNLMITNVPGPATETYLLGCKCRRQFGLIPIGDGLGLCISAPSYNGEIAITPISTPEIIPDLGFFMRCVQESFDELLTCTR